MTTPTGPLAPIPGTGPCVTGGIAVADGDLSGDTLPADIDLDAERWDDAHPIIVTAVTGCGTCGADALLPGDICCGHWTPPALTR